MQRSKSKRTQSNSRKKYRFVKASTRAETRTTARRKRSGRQVTVKAPTRSSVRSAAASLILQGKETSKPARKPSATVDRETPGWEDLKGATNGRQSASPEESHFISAMSTVRISLTILAVAALFTLYVGHVQATQDLLDKVYQAEKENTELAFELSELTGRYESHIGPSTIYRRAQELGLAERRVAAKPVIVPPTSN